VTRFAFYGRVSTEDQQDPASSKAWQLSRSTALIEPKGGQVVAEFFDIGLSRSLPWKRRPEAARLLDALADPQRGFDAVVIGEPARAFYGAQFQNTFPLFVHYGVELWVPDVGGHVDPTSDGPEMMMAIYGTMSSQERRRVKIRVRSSMAEQAATEGRFLGGRPPYGYRLADGGPHPNPGKAAVGQRLHRLEIDPVAAPVVQRMFAEYIAGSGIFAIAERLTADGIPSPSAHDPARNRHRQTSKGAWSKSAVRSILTNPKYTGRMSWNRQRRDEVLIDVEDVAAGHLTKMRWNDRADWILSAEPTHEAIVSPEVFAAAEAQRGQGAHRASTRKRRTQRSYVLRRLIRCGCCGRAMQGHWANDRAMYRCRFPAEYALTEELGHPKNVYVREDAILPRLDAWLARVLDADNLDATVKVMAEVQAVDEAAVARAEAARRKLADCDARLAKYRTALEAGTDPVLVGQWITEVKAERAAAERAVAAAAPTAPLSEAEIHQMDRGHALAARGPGRR
jgi:site-specific DNA recombinase